MRMTNVEFEKCKKTLFDIEICISIKKQFMITKYYNIPNVRKYISNA